MIPIVLDCETWDLTFDVPSTDNEPFDPAGSRFTAVVRATTGGPILATLTTANGSLVVTGGTTPRVRVVAPLGDRTWRAPARTKVMADVMRHLGADDAGAVAFVRLEWWVEPATQSDGIARGGPAVVLKPFQPGGVTTLPVLRGPQGPPIDLPPIPPDAASVSYTLGLVAGALAWVRAGAVTPTPDPTPGVLDFSEPANSGLLAAFLFAQPAAPSAGAGALDFTDPANSGLAALVLAAA